MADDTRSGAASPLASGADIRTFLFADMRGYTGFTQEHGDEAASALAGRFADLVRDAVPRFEGELLELRGDEALCVFRSARQALRASVELQRRLRTGSDDESAFPIGVGMGLDAGEAVPTEGGYRGVSLNLAARLCGIARGGEVLATERLVRLAGPVEGLSWTAPRSVRLKGVSDPERVVEVRPDWPLPPLPPAPDRAAGSHKRRGWIVVAGLLLAVVVVVGFVALGRGGSSPRSGSALAPPRTLAEVSPTGRLIGAVRLPADPESITVGAGQVWVGGSDQTVTPVSVSRRRAAQPIGLGIDPAELAYGDGAVWAFDNEKLLAEVDAQHHTMIGPPHQLCHCKIESGGILQSTSPPPCGAHGLAVVSDEIWVANDYGSYGVAGEIDRFRTSRLAKVGSVSTISAGPVATYQGQVWMWANQGQEVDLINSQRVVQRTLLPVPASYTGGGIAVGSGYAWVAAPSTGQLFGIAAGQQTPKYQYPVPRGVTCITTGGGAIWLGAPHGQVIRVNPYTGTKRTYHIARTTPAALAYTTGRVWVALGPA